MKQDERKALIGKYILLVLGSVLILVPLLATLLQTHQGYRRQFLWLSNQLHMGQL